MKNEIEVKRIIRVLNYLQRMGQIDMNMTTEYVACEIAKEQATVGYPEKFVRWLLFEQTKYRKTYGRMDENMFYNRYLFDHSEEETLVCFSLGEMYAEWKSLPEPKKNTLEENGFNFETGM